MNAIEFVTELSGSSVLTLPSDVVSRLPKSGRARVLVLTDDDSGDEEWQTMAYRQFLRDDSVEDAVYDSLK